MTWRHWARGSVLLLLALVTSSDVAKSSFRIPEALIVRTLSASASMEAVHEELLETEPGSGSFVTRSEFERRARARGSVEQQQLIRVDGHVFALEQSQTDFIKLRVGEATNEPAPKAPVKRQRIPIDRQVHVKDETSGGPVVINMFSYGGRSLVDEIAKGAEVVALAVLPEIIGFQDRQARAEQTQRQFQQHYQQAQKQSAAYIQDIQRQTHEIQQATLANQGVGYERFALGLMESPYTRLTADQVQAFESARVIENDDLHEAKYEMNKEAYAMLEGEFERAMAGGQYSAAVKTLEALQYAEVFDSTTGASAGLSGLRSSELLAKHTNESGVAILGSGSVGGPGLFDSISLETDWKSSEGQAVRRLMNRYQVLWAESDGLSTLSQDEAARAILGAASLAAADQELSQGDLVRGSGLMRVADIMLESVMGFGAGLGASLKGLVTAVPDLATLVGKAGSAIWSDPVAAWEATVGFITNLDEFSGAVVTAVAKDFDKLESGTAYERGEFIGQYALDVIGMFATGGGAAVLVGGKKLGHVSKVLASMPASARAKAVEAIGLAKGVVASMPPPVRAGFSAIKTHSPLVLVDAGRAYVKARRQGHLETADYIAKMMASKTKLGWTPSSFRKAVAFHEMSLEFLKDIEGISVSGTFTRAISKTVNIDGKTITLGKKDVFAKHGGQVATEHRFTIGGEYGNSGMYMVQGKMDDVGDVALKEARIDSKSKAVLGEANFEFDRILDFNDKRVKEMFDSLGVSKGDLNAEYLFSQAFGDAAKQRGFKGIRFTSAQVDSATNIAIFN
ncbi:MAG: RES family NAD+ phosphorylase [Bdellovibrionales bacterium]|jgi:hypothetical protein|nr:RES family NAD+ phosphorylase [Bdellovibrionales bacterium]